MSDERQRVYLTRLDPVRHWALSEHAVMGRVVLPGTAYLEMARAALAAELDVAGPAMRRGAGAASGSAGPCQPAKEALHRRKQTLQGGKRGYA